MDRLSPDPETLLEAAFALLALVFLAALGLLVGGAMKSLGRQLSHELVVARTELRHGRFERSMALMTAFAAIVSGWEAYAQHLRGDFSHWLMWTPVGLTPPTVLAS